MSTAARTSNYRSKGSALILSMIFVLVFSALAVSFAAISGANVQVASNQHKINTALYAAQSGLECAKYLVGTVPLNWTMSNFVDDDEADDVWDTLCVYSYDEALDGKEVNYDDDELTITEMTLDGLNATFTVRFCRDADDPRIIVLESTGTHDGGASRTVCMTMAITKDREVLNYAVASRGRIWLDEGSVVHGPLFSTWNRPEVGPGIETAPDTAVYGTVGTVISLADFQANGIQMETLGDNDQAMFYFGVSAFDDEGNPVSDTYGPVDNDGYLLDLDLNPVYDEDGNRIFKDYDLRCYSSSDYVRGYHEDILYDVPFNSDMPGMQPGDYDTSDYKTMCSEIGSHSSTTTEYFPHAEGNYSLPRSSSSFQYSRRVYENQTFSNVRVPQGKHALFKNCTFEDVLFIETHESYYNHSNYTNNIRFEDCTFNGVIVTDVPTSTNHYSWWMRNALTFTGASVFNNTSSIQDATVLAPNFNVNIGSTAQVGDTSNSIIKGAVVGGIVDVYGDATIQGTIISMYDTSAHSSGYITNIGDREDGGSESYGTIQGQIDITPDPDQLLPSGISSPIVIQPDQSTYSEAI